jgi:hypothetical protein
MPAEDFPDLPLVQSGTPIRLEADALVKGLRATLFASSGDEAKQLLTGVHLRLDPEGLECAATDGHRLAVLRLAHGTPDSMGDTEGEGEPFAVTVPARSLRELERLFAFLGRIQAEPELREQINWMQTALEVSELAAAEGQPFRPETLIALLQRAQEAPSSRVGLMDEKLIRIYLRRDSLL